MNIQEFKFPKTTGIDFAFPTFNTIPELLNEARDRGFYGGNTKYNKMFSTLFFGGGTVKFKEDLNEEFKKNAWSYMRAFMGSFSPKHEEKEAICALLLSELVEPELEKAK
jgi:hypothetical protein